MASMSLQLAKVLKSQQEYHSSGDIILASLDDGSAVIVGSGLAYFALMILGMSGSIKEKDISLSPNHVIMVTYP